MSADLPRHGDDDVLAGGLTSEKSQDSNPTKLTLLLP